MEIIAKYKSARSSDQKLRLITKIIKYNDSIENILYMLLSLNKKSGFLIRKVIKSAVSNAKHNFSLNVEDLKLKQILIYKGPSFKRISIRAKGKMDYISKKTSHIKVIVCNKNYYNK